MSTITKKPYPLGIDNPYQIRGRIGTSKWEIIDRETRQCLGVYPNETCAMMLVVLFFAMLDMTLKLTEDFVRLNVQEIGILISALELLSTADENRIAKEYGSAPALYNKLYSVWEQMDTSKTGIRYDVVPS